MKHKLAFLCAAITLLPACVAERNRILPPATPQPPLAIIPYGQEARISHWGITAGGVTQENEHTVVKIRVRYYGYETSTSIASALKFDLLTHNRVRIPRGGTQSPRDQFNVRLLRGGVFEWYAYYRNPTASNEDELILVVDLDAWIYTADTVWMELPPPSSPTPPEAPET